MGIELLTERHAKQIEGVLGCWDRMQIFGTLPKVCYAAGMTSYLYERKVRIFHTCTSPSHFGMSCDPMPSGWRWTAALRLSSIRKRNVRNEDRVKQILAQRGGQHPSDPNGKAVTIAGMLELVDNHLPLFQLRQ